MWEIQVSYDGCKTWDVVAYEDTYEDAVRTFNDYVENEEKYGIGIVKAVFKPGGKV
ncbi:MAG: hypothetical protein IJJ44_12595 [Solobacterium sp.]|nr:hypothetical protein [Solobacterium sp.]